MKVETNSLSTISEWFLTSATETVEKVSTVPASSNVIEGTLTLDGAASVATKQGREDDETALLRTSTSEEPDEPNLLDWRMNPKTSLADWTVVITTPGRTAAKYYHVHRNIIMLPSRYFRKLFKKQRKTGGRSDFHLPDAAAAVFPDFLDYLYRLGCETFTRNNSVPLYYLSRIFNVDRLRWETRKFWEKDMSARTIAHYYESAILFEEESLMAVVLEACADEQVLSSLDCESDVLSNENPRMMLYLVENSDAKHSEKLSMLIAKFCMLHQEAIDKNVFLNLTKPLSSVSLEAACTLLIQERSFSQPSGVTQLQKSCIRTLSQNWAALDVTEPTFKDMLTLQGPLFLAELYRRTTLAAQGRAHEEFEDGEESVEDGEVQEMKIPVENVKAPNVTGAVDPILRTRTDDDKVVIADV